MYTQRTDTSDVCSAVEDLSVLHLLATITPHSVLHELCLPAAHKVGIVSFYPPDLNLPSRIDVYGGSGEVVGFYSVLRRVLESDRYDIVHVHDVPVAFLYLLYSWFSPGSSPKSVFTVHHSFWNENLKYRNRVLLAPIFYGFDRLVFVSNASKTSYPSLYLKLAGSGSVNVIRNGVNLEAVDEVIRDHKRQSAETQLLMLWVGRLIRIKDPFVILESVSRLSLRPWKLMFVGQGECMTDLEDLAAELSVRDQVEFVGRVTRKEVYRQMAKAHVFVSGSRGEAMPIAVLEAMACSCPVILSDIEAHREITDGLDCVRLVPVGDADGFRRELERIATMSDSERRRIGKACRKAVVERFNVDYTLRSYESLYAELLGFGRK